MAIDLTKEEIEDVLSNLDQCLSEGYLNAGDPAMDAFEKMRHALHQIQQESLEEWIEFKDKMPNHNQYVKVKSDDLWHGEGIFQDGRFVYSWVKGACCGIPTHWMPLKKVSKEK